MPRINSPHTRTSPRRVEATCGEKSDEDAESDYETDLPSAREMVRTLRKSEQFHDAPMLQMVLDGEEDHFIAMLVLRMMGCLKRHIRKPSCSL